MKNDHPIYDYDVLSIYDYLSNYRDDYAFRKLDSLIFPSHGRKYFGQISLPLAYTRLYCLFKHQLPYSGWIDKVREFMHETPPTTSDICLLISFSHFN